MMRLLYATSFVASGRANRMQVIAMAREFKRALGENFWLGHRDKTLQNSRDFNSIYFSSRKSFSLAWRYLEFAKGKGADIVYCREPRLLLFAVLWNRLFFNLEIEFIYEVHRIIDDNFVNQFAEKVLSFFTDKYIFVTRHLADMYAKKYDLKNKQIFLAPDGVDMAIFDIEVSKEEARKRLNLPLDKKIIGYAGRFKTMEEDKGLIDVLEALKLLSKDVVLVAMGGKPGHVEEFKKIAEEKGLGGRAVFRGHFTQDIVALYQKAYDVLLMPFPDIEHYRYFMSPMKMFEYMASKRPIVASDLPSVREVLNDENAVLIEPDNPKSLAEGIIKVLGDSRFAEKISSKAYEDSKKYTWEKRANRIIEFINE